MLIRQLTSRSAKLRPCLATATIARRQMASNRNHPIAGASNEDGITEEVRDLIRNVRHSENVDSWQRGPLMEEPVTAKAWRPNHDVDIDDDQGYDLTYWPNRDDFTEEGSLWKKKAEEGFEPPLVLIVRAVGKVSGEPWWNKEAMEKLGLGKLTGYEGKKVAVPNMTHWTSVIYRVKHLVEVIPVYFPHGIPSEEEFDKNMASVTHDGNFLYHPRIGEAGRKIEAGIENAEHLKITQRVFRRKAHQDWQMNPNSPFGNSNYNRDTGLFNRETADRASDTISKVKY